MSSTSHRHANRNGVTLVAVMVCLGLITALLLGAFTSSLKQRRQLDRELQMEQTRWLARAAIAHGEAIAGDQDVSKTGPIILRPKLGGDLQSKVRIEFKRLEDKNTVSAQAWIGDEDRPERNTQIELHRILKKLPEDSSRDET